MIKVIFYSVIVILLYIYGIILHYICKWGNQIRRPKNSTFLMIRNGFYVGKAFIRKNEIILPGDSAQWNSDGTLSAIPPRKTEC